MPTSSSGSPGYKDSKGSHQKPSGESSSSHLTSPTKPPEDQCRNVVTMVMRDFFRNNFQYPEFKEKQRAGKKGNYGLSEAELELVAIHDAKYEQLSRNPDIAPNKENFSILVGEVVFRLGEGRLEKLPISKPINPGEDMAEPVYSIDSKKTLQGDRLDSLERRMVEFLLTDEGNKWIQDGSDLSKAKGSGKGHISVFGSITEKVKEIGKGRFSDELIKQKIIDVRGHAEEAMMQIIESEEFVKKFQNKVKELYSKHGNINAELLFQSTKEVCQICQPQLKHIEGFLQQKAQEILDITDREQISQLSPSSLSAASTLAKVKLSITSRLKSSDRDHTPPTINRDIDPIQSEANRELKAGEVDPDISQQYTICANTIIKKAVSIADYLNSEEIRARFIKQQREFDLFKQQTQQQIEQQKLESQQ